MRCFKFEKDSSCLALNFLLVSFSVLSTAEKTGRNSTLSKLTRTKSFNSGPRISRNSSGGGLSDRGHKPTFRVASNNCEVTLAIILCNSETDTDTNVDSKKESKRHVKLRATINFGRQINQTLVLLKSILITSKYSGSSSCVRVLVVAEEKEHFERIKTRIYRDEKWDSGFTQFLKLLFVKARYPPGTERMRNKFRPCATLRLFLPDLLKSYETMIYVDTDFIFLRSVQELWSEFHSFSNVTLGGMTSNSGYYESKRNQVPFYGSTGLNAGLMLMNLTRMRETQWTHKILRDTQIFQTQIKLADQDMLNIYFHYHPEELHFFSCDWNYRPTQCQSGQYCENTRTLTEGISALHGIVASFTPFGAEPLFHLIFNLFQTTSLHSNFSLRIFIQRLDFLLQTKGKYPRSSCAKYRAFNVFLLNRLNRLLQVQQKQEK